MDALNVSSIITESVRLMMWNSKVGERIGVMVLPVVPLGENKIYIAVKTKGLSQLESPCLLDKKGLIEMLKKFEKKV